MEEGRFRRRLDMLRGASLREAARLVFRKALYRRVTLRRYELRGGMAGQPRHPNPFPISVLDPTGPDFDALLLEANPHLDADDIDHLRRQDGSLCFVARDGDRIVASSWITRGRVWINELQRSVTVDGSEHMRYRSYVDPEFRGNSLHAHLIRAMSEHIPAGEVLWGYVYPWNLASIYSGESIGQRHTGNSTTIHLLGLRIAHDRRFPPRPRTTRRPVDGTASAGSSEPR